MELSTVIGGREKWNKLDMFVLETSRPGRVREAVLGSSVDDVQPTVDSLDEYVKAVVVDHPLRKNAVGLLQTLCRKTNTVPSGLIIPNVLFDGRQHKKMTVASDIYQGTYLGRPVAVKRLRLEAHVRKYFFREVVTWAYIQHKHILAFVGIHVEQDDHHGIPMLVSFWMHNGTLRDYVKTERYTRNFNPERIRLAAEVACGLAYLHSQSIVHGDIKDSNILIGDDHEALIADFGLAHLSDFSGDTTAPGIRGTEAWMAPERFDRSKTRRTYAMDVYAFACVCYMLCVGKHIFHWLPEAEVRHKVLKGVRPGRPKCLDHKLLKLAFFNLMEKCWRQAPEARISMNNVLAYFNMHPSNALGPAPLFMAQARQDYDPPLDQNTQMAFKKKEWFEVFDCTSENWVVRRLDGAVGHLSKPSTRLYPSTVAMAVVIQKADDNAHCLSKDLLLDVLQVRIDQVLEVLSFDEDWWIVRPSKDPLNIGVAFSGNLRPHWPHPDPSRTSLATAIFSYSRGFQSHLSFKAGDVFEVQALHPNDRWLIGRLDGHTGVVPAYYLRIAKSQHQKSE